MIGLEEPDSKDSGSGGSAIWSGAKAVGSLAGEEVIDILVEVLDEETGIPLSDFVEAFKQNG